MKTSARPKTKLLFPNSWAAQSFLLRLKRNAEWEYLASSDNRHIQVKPKGAREAIEILVNQGREGHLIQLELNAEKLGDGADAIWNAIFDHARRYRC